MGRRFEKVYLVGNGRVADECLKIFYDKKVVVTYIEVISEKFSFTKKLCERYGIEFCHIDEKKFKNFLIGIKEETLIISAHNSYIFPAIAVEKKNLTIVNLHVAYLPEYRGMNPSTWAIFNEESDSGVTWHEVGGEIDKGGIIIQKRVPIMEDDTAMTLMLRCFREGIKLFMEIFDMLLAKNYNALVPEEFGDKIYLSKELPNNGLLDLNWTFRKTYAFLRSMDYRGTNIMPLPQIEIGKKNTK